MKVQFKFFLLGLLTAGLLFVCAFFSLLLVVDDQPTIFREQRLPSGKTIKVMSFHLAWGDDHGNRLPDEDTLAFEYVSSMPGADQGLKNQEAMEVFALVHAASEQWGFKSATLSAFPTTARKGQYDIFVFKQASNGSWSFQRSPAKVHIND